MSAGGKRVASSLFIYGLMVVFLAVVVIGAVQLIERPRARLTRVTIGTRDEVYYLHAATPQEARALGEALRQTGFLNDRGTTVLLSKGTAGTLVSFVLNDGAWDRPDAVASFEEIGRRVASSVGGFPIKVRLIDSRRILHKELTVGKQVIGSKDAVYYFGSATEAEAQALGEALRSVGFFRDLGASVILSEGQERTVSFPVNEGVWDRPDAVASFQRMVRQIAPAIGGLPIQLRLLNGEMESQKTVGID